MTERINTLCSRQKLELNARDVGARPRCGSEKLGVLRHKV